MKFKKYIFVTFFLALIFLCSNLGAEGFERAIKDSLKELGLKKGDQRLCVLTNASYVLLQEKTTESYVDFLIKETGASIGKGNFLFFHSRQDEPLKVALFRKDSGDLFFLTYDGQNVKKVTHNLSLERIKERDFFPGVQKALGPDGFRVSTILWIWTSKAPYDLLKAAEFHDHLCPGVTSGYLLSKFIKRHYPSQKGVSLRFIACPPWCKDDAIQVLLNLTPGKRGLFVMELSEKQKNELLDSNVAGILILFDQEKKSGKAVILGFDWQKVYEAVQVVPNEDETVKRIKTATGLIRFLNEPERFCSVLKEIPIDEAKLSRLSQAGSNPYEVLEFLKK